MNLRELIDEATESRDSVNEEREALIKADRELIRLRQIEGAVKAILEQPVIYNLSFAAIKTLRESCGLVPSVQPASSVDDPWDRKPGRKYTAIENPFCARKGEVVEVLAQAAPFSYSVKNLNTDQVYYGAMLDKQSWRLPTAEENAAKPEGTLVQNFEDLKVGDKVRIERKRGDVPQVGFPAVQNDYVLEDTLAQFYDDSWGKWWGTTEGHCLDLREVTNGRVRLLSSAKRKPYVRDGRWVAEAGDRFRHLHYPCVTTVLEVTSGANVNYTCQDGNGETKAWALYEWNWEPVS